MCPFNPAFNKLQITNKTSNKIFDINVFAELCKQYYIQNNTFFTNIAYITHLHGLQKKEKKIIYIHMFSVINKKTKQNTLIYFPNIS